MKDQDQTERERQARDIFLRAVEIHLPEAQAAYLEGACQHDASLRSRVEALLGNHRKDSFLETAAISGAPTAISQTAISEGPGTVIGRYTLLQMIGDGGFGVVYMAEQKEPVRRRVALKI
ncbi:MAG: serine/threonine protein kinase, partial [Verrucomicrobia bacterium]|nr:serine/threonine protein kinase [Verrucomicrobiota bacterium]